MARAAGMLIDWDDLDELSRATPLLARVYPNGSADVNHFHAAGGIGFVIRELIDAGLLHADIRLRARRRPARSRRWSRSSTASRCVGAKRRRSRCDASVVRGVADPFDSEGGLRRLQGNLGRAIVKISAVAPEYRTHRSAGAHLRIAGRAAGSRSRPAR